MTDSVTQKTHTEIRRISKEEIDNLNFDVRIDTSQDNPWTKEGYDRGTDATAGDKRVGGAG